MAPSKEKNIKYKKSSKDKATRFALKVRKIRRNLKGHETMRKEKPKTTEKYMSPKEKKTLKKSQLHNCFESH